jgi:RND family efflux transporter MFP subunit
MTNEDLSKLKIEKSGALYRRGKPKRRVLWIGASLVVVFLIVLYSAVLNPSVEVEVSTVSLIYPSQTFTLLNASGYVVAQRKAAVSSKATGRLEWLGVEEGSKVKKGEVVARLEGRDVAAARDQAAANLDNARSALEQAKAELNDAALNFNRSKELLAKGFISQMDYDTADARYRRAQATVSGAGSAIISAQAALKGADVAVEYTLIRAPFDAVVLTKDADIGDMVTPLGAAANAKAAVVTIADMSSLQVEADVSESNLEKVKRGQPCEIQLDAFPESRFRGMVHMIVPTADRSKASVMVKVRFLDKDKRILPEMSARVSFLERPVAREEEQPRTGMNPGAVVTRNSKQVVFQVRGGRVSEVQVTTGEKIGEMIEVTSGVKAGDKVVVNPPQKLRTGSKISIKEG